MYQLVAVVVSLMAGARMADKLAMIESDKAV